jgi:hypothetical protein
MAKRAVSSGSARGTTHLIVAGLARHERRAWAIVLPARHGTIIYFYFTKKSYIHMYNLYSIIKIYEHNVLLVRRLHLVFPALLPLGCGFEPTYCTAF